MVREVTLDASGTASGGKWSINGGCFSEAQSLEIFGCDDSGGFGLLGLTSTGLDKNTQISAVKEGGRWYVSPVGTVLDVVDHGLNVAEAENAPRVHDQLYPDELRIERGISLDTIRLLEAMGHKVVVGNSMGSANSILRSKDGVLTGASDPRQRGTLAVGY